MQSYMTLNALLDHFELYKFMVASPQFKRWQNDALQKAKQKLGKNLAPAHEQDILFQLEEWFAAAWRPEVINQMLLTNILEDPRIPRLANLSYEELRHFVEEYGLAEAASRFAERLNPEIPPMDRLNQKG